MSSCIVFNHHSLPCDSSKDADVLVSEFLKICIACRNVGISPILVAENVDKDWFRLEIGPQYFWQDWVAKNNKESKDQIRAFRSIATNQPLFQADDIEKGADLFDVCLDQWGAFEALRAAAWHEAPVTSFPSRQPWNTSPLHLRVETLDSNEDLALHDIPLLNIYSMEVFLEQLPVIQQKRNALIRSGRELFARRTDFFPNLIFCGKAPQQLKSWSASTTIFEQIKESLLALDAFCDKWKQGIYDAYAHGSLRDSGLKRQVSGESESVLNDPKLCNERIFWTPEGEKKIFQNHVKLSNGYRLHFYPSHEKKVLYVGYIGPHLRLK